jgi:uncharacterized coiled-coil protein SlyX
MGGHKQDEGMEDRIRIFEDEIINRIKIIQSFVKNLDGKVKRNRTLCKGAHVPDSNRKSHHMHSASRHSVEESDRGAMDNTNNEAGVRQMVREAMKWEVEIVEKKTEERFKEIEALIRKVGVRMDKA